LLRILPNQRKKKKVRGVSDKLRYKKEKTQEREGGRGPEPRTKTAIPFYMGGHEEQERQPGGTGLSKKKPGHG